MNGYVNVLEHHGFCALLIIVLLTVATPLLKNWAEHTKLFLPKRPKQSQLIKHSFFTHMQYWRKLGIDAIELACPAKSHMVRDFLHCQFRIFDIAMREVVHNKSIKNLSQSELKHHLKTLTTDSVKSYEAEAQQMGIPKVFIHRFKKWHHRSLLFMMDGIEDACTNTYYKTNVERLNGILGILLVTFNATLIDAEKTINELNGELTGLTYKNLTILH